MTHFEVRTPPGVQANGAPHAPVEYVHLRVGNDVVLRRATDEDRQAHRVEYAAFMREARTAVAQTLAEKPPEASLSPPEVAAVEEAQAAVAPTGFFGKKRKG